MSYKIQDGKIIATNLEVDVVDHCNLSCRSCSHLSPVLAKSSVSPDGLAQDLESLTRVFHTSRLKVLGGEPLLHPALDSVLRVIRDSGITDTIALITNGHRLDHIADSALAFLDEIVVSAYTSSPPASRVLENIRARAEGLKVKFTVNHFHRFRETFSCMKSTRPDLTRRIYAQCEITHVYNCFNVRDGFFYKCPQARSLGKYFRLLPQVDGIELSDPVDLLDRIVTYLASKEPLQACANCLGTVGLRFAHEQVSRNTWNGYAARPIDELLDLNQLEALECGARGHAPPTFNKAQSDQILSPRPIA